MSRVGIETLRQELREFQEAHPVWTLDNAFVHWFLRAFLVADDDLAGRAVTGVSHDKGIDAIYIDDEVNKVFLLQGKCHLGARPPNEKRNDVLSFARIARAILGTQAEFAAYRKGIDPIVAKLLESARRRLITKQYSLHLYYVTTGSCSSPLKGEVESEVNQANGLSNISVLDRSDILALLEDYIGGAAPPVPSLDLKVDSRGVVGSDGMIQRFDQKTDIESWILTMTGRDVGSLFRNAGDRLFARNIRGSRYLLDATNHNRLWFHQFRERNWLSLNGLLRQSIEQFPA